MNENDVMMKEAKVQSNLASQLVQANSEIKIAGEEIDNLKIKLKQVEKLSHVTELKEENAMLAERLSQLEENKMVDNSRGQVDEEDVVGKLREDINKKDKMLMDLNEKLLLAESFANKHLQANEELHRRNINEMEEKHKTRINQLEVELEKRSVGFGWDDQHDSAEDLCGDSPAIFGVPNHTQHPASHGHLNQNNHNHVSQLQPASQLSIEESPEFEYMRNILYEYMMGRQPLVLAKVLSTIVKFTDDQTRAVVNHEQKKQSFL